jgi:cysteine desulfurase/selenocysteine lyase
MWGGDPCGRPRPYCDRYFEDQDDTDYYILVATLAVALVPIVRQLMTTVQQSEMRSAADIRKDFPILSRQVHGHPLVYLDSTASSQKPHAVIEAMSTYYETTHANVHRGVYEISEEATTRMEKARVKVARFINARQSKQVIFTRNTTESINLVAYSWGNTNIVAGDRIVLTELEHHSNLVPWQLLAQRTGALLEFVPITDDGLLRLDIY